MTSRPSALWRLKQFALFDIGALPYAVLTAQPTWRAHGAQLADLTGVSEGDKLLDLGCGPGESAFGMAERVPGLRVTGLDYSETMLRIARARRRRDRSGGTVDLVQANAMDLPFPDATFRGVTGHSFLYLVPDAARVVAEAKRVLLPGGRCAFLEPANVGDHPLLPPEIRRQTLGDPRFVASMALWRVVSRRYGRFDEARFTHVFEGAGLRVVEIRPTLGGLGYFGVAERRPIRALADVDWTRFTPHDRATLLFVVEKDRVLLIRKKRGLGAGKINAPGGRIEPDESPVEGAIRECQEELCITPSGVEDAGELHFQFADGYSLSARVFRASSFTGTPTETVEATPIWAPIDRIPFSEMWADDALWIPLMLERKRFSGRFVFDGDAMLEHRIDVR